MYNVPKGLQFKQILSIQRILGGKKSTNIKQKYFMIIKMIINNRAVIIIHNNWAANQHIRMIFEGPCCDTEDWSNDAEN